MLVLFLFFIASHKYRLSFLNPPQFVLSVHPLCFSLGRQHIAVPVSALAHNSGARKVGWADSLSHRLYLFHKAMDMVAADGGKKGGMVYKGKGGRWGRVDELPRAGEMMAGLARQSQTLAVYIGLEDAPDGSGEVDVLA